MPRFLFAQNMAKAKYDSRARVFVAVVSDLHIGSTIALCPPDGIALEDGGTYQPSQVQKWIWAKWVQYWADVKQAVGMSPLIVVVNGEFVDGNHHQTSQIATPSESQMVDAAINVMSKPATMAKELYVTIGTRVHSGAGGGFDHLIAKELGARVDPETGRSAFYHLPLQIKNTLFDFAHHISGSTRETGAGTNIKSECIDVRLETHGRRCPDVVVRSHVHNCVDTGINVRGMYGIVTPAWQLASEHTNRIKRQIQRKVGGLLFEVTANKWEMHKPLIYELPDVPTIKSKL
jgi:hypothetical protein